MRFEVFSYGMPMKLYLTFRIEKSNAANDPALIIRVYDNRIRKAEYHNRRVPVTKEGDLSVSLYTPVTADEKMIVEVGAEHGNPSKFSLKKIDCDFLNIHDNAFTKKELDFIESAEYFSKHLGGLNTGVWHDNLNKFILLDSILDDISGSPIPTPARVDHDTGEIEINKNDFLKYTIPMRMFILMHERTHYIDDSTNEINSDISATEALLMRGYPKIELLYAATKIFPDSPESRQRVSALENFINDYGNIDFAV